VPTCLCRDCHAALEKIDPRRIELAGYRDASTLQALPEAILPLSMSRDSFFR